MADKIDDVLLYLMVEGLSKEAIINQTGVSLSDIYIIAEKNNMERYKYKRALPSSEKVKIPENIEVPTGKTQKEITERDYILIELRQAGLTYNEIIDATGVTKNAITRALAKRGLTRDRHDCIHNWQEIALSLVGKVPIHKLCAMIHVSQQRIIAFFKEKGIDYLVHNKPKSRATERNINRLATIVAKK